MHRYTYIYIYCARATSNDINAKTYRNINNIIHRKASKTCFFLALQNHQRQNHRETRLQHLRHAHAVLVAVQKAQPGSRAGFWSP